MGKMVNVNFRLEEGLKEEFEKTCDIMGISMTAAFTAFTKKVAMEKRIPFALTAYPETAAGKKEGETRNE